MSVFDGVKKILLEQSKLKPTDITLEATLVDDLGFDSLGFVEVILPIEEENKVTISDEDARKFRAVNDLVNYITNAKSS